MERPSFAHLGCWQNSISCVCSIKISISCLAMVKVISFLMRSPYSLAFGLFLCIQSQQCWVESPFPLCLSSFSQLIFKIQLENVSTFLWTRGQIESIRWFRIFSPSPPIQVLIRPDPAQLPRSGTFRVVWPQTFPVSRSTALIKSRGSLLPCKVTQSQVPRDWSMNILGRILFCLPLMASFQEGKKKQIQTLEAAKVPQLACQPNTNKHFL